MLYILTRPGRGGGALIEFRLMAHYAMPILILLFWAYYNNSFEIIILFRLNIPN